MRFLKEMDDYLDPDYAFCGLTEKSRIDDVNQNPDLISKNLFTLLIQKCLLLLLEKNSTKNHLPA